MLLDVSDIFVRHADLLLLNVFLKIVDFCNNHSKNFSQVSTINYLFSLMIRSYISAFYRYGYYSFRS